VMEARLRDGKVIHVDPRYSRTSAVSHLHVSLRAGSDIAFLGGIINYILEHGPWRGQRAAETELSR
jgi:formate dehydrogenase major subunit